jgi:hypothetical protein
MVPTSHALPTGRAYRLLATVLPVLSVALVVRPAAASNEGGLDRGWGANAYWFSTEGCIETTVRVFAVAGTWVGADLIQRDICADPAVTLLDATTGQSQEQAEDALTINPGLSKAELHAATVTVTDAVSGSSFLLYIDLVWERVGGRGDCSSTPEGPHPPPEGVQDITCSAVVTGTVSDGPTNYTPIPGNGVLELHRGFAD